jgi:hypothetical protein
VEASDRHQTGNDIRQVLLRLVTCVAFYVHCGSTVFTISTFSSLGPHLLCCRRRLCTMLLTIELLKLVVITAISSCGTRERRIMSFGGRFDCATVSSSVHACKATIANAAHQLCLREMKLAVYRCA